MFRYDALLQPRTLIQQATSSSNNSRAGSPLVQSVPSGSSTGIIRLGGSNSSKNGNSLKIKLGSKSSSSGKVILRRPSRSKYLEREEDELENSESEEESEDDEEEPEQENVKPTPSSSKLTLKLRRPSDSNTVKNNNNKRRRSKVNVSDDDNEDDDRDEPHPHHPRKKASSHSTVKKPFTSFFSSIALRDSLIFDSELTSSSLPAKEENTATTRGSRRSSIRVAQALGHKLPDSISTLTEFVLHGGEGENGEGESLQLMMEKRMATWGEEENKVLKVGEGGEAGVGLVTGSGGGGGRNQVHGGIVIPASSFKDLYHLPSVPVPAPSTLSTLSTLVLLDQGNETGDLQGEGSPPLLPTPTRTNSLSSLSSSTVPTPEAEVQVELALGLIGREEERKDEEMEVDH